MLPILLKLSTFHLKFSVKIINFCSSLQNLIVNFSILLNYVARRPMQHEGVDERDGDVFQLLDKGSVWAKTTESWEYRAGQGCHQKSGPVCYVSKPDRIFGPHEEKLSQHVFRK